LPQAFGGKERIARFAGRVFTPEGDGEGGVALGPSAFYGFAIDGDGAFEVRADGSDFEFENGAAKGSGSSFDGINGLIETVEGSVEFALRILAKVENEMELGFAGLQSAGINAIDDGSRGGNLRAGRQGCGGEKGV